ncbi:MAG: patatin-like phospholipase family protein [Bacteroidota bacterium]|nr:patatin-like phospholipase family protein [Bacteroidota bacterium]
MSKQLKPKNALVLGGGSVKGSSQAGVISEILNKGFVPDASYGVSVGALNGAFLAAEAGKRKRRKLK